MEKILEIHPLAVKLFDSDNIGIIYFVNNSEPSVSLENYGFKSGDRIDLVYINRDWDSKKFEG